MLAATHSNRIGQVFDSSHRQVRFEQRMQGLRRVQVGAMTGQPGRLRHEGVGEDPRAGQIRPDLGEGAHRFARRLSGDHGAVERADTGPDGPGRERCHARPGRAACRSASRPGRHRRRGRTRCRGPSFEASHLAAGHSGAGLRLQWISMPSCPAASSRSPSRRPACPHCDYNIPPAVSPVAANPFSDAPFEPVPFEPVASPDSSPKWRISPLHTFRRPFRRPLRRPFLRRFPG